jgi:glucosamine--fructose-6-phosphate aminotransferase (isomerizing)
MFIEIQEESIALRQTLTAATSTCHNIASELAGEEVGMVYFSGSGTSYHAALASQYLMSSLSTVPTNSIPASEFDSWVRASPSGTSVVVIISQSGESVDALSVLGAAKKKRIRSIGITNTPKSTLAEMSDFAVITRAGPESAITATKTFVSCIAAGYLLTLEMVNAWGAFAGSVQELADLRRELLGSPSIVQETIRRSIDEADVLAKRFVKRSLFFLLGHGAGYATALEGALKLKESCNVMAEGHAAREFLHGPMQLVDENTPVFMISLRRDYGSLAILSESFKRLGAPIVEVSDTEVSTSPQDHLHVEPGLSDSLSPLAFIVPIQLFAYYSAVSRGLDPDKPTKLSKVVK